MAVHPAIEIARRQLRRGTPVTVGDLVLTPVVLEERGAGTTARGCWVVAAKRPVAIIVSGPGARRLVRLDNLVQGN